MPLTQIAVVSTTPAKPDTRINLQASGNAVMYTVPTGRKFVGFFNVHLTGWTSALKINSKEFKFGGTDTGGQYKLELVAGDIVATWLQTGSLFGIESDA
jgi:hypothetical protein